MNRIDMIAVEAGGITPDFTLPSTRLFRMIFQALGQE